MNNTSPIDAPRLADEILDTIHKLCEERGLTYFLYEGTCLAFYRDGDYVDDNDLDIVVVSTEEEYKELWAALAAHPGWNDAAGLRYGLIQIDLHYTDKALPYYVIPTWRPEPYTFGALESVYHRATRRGYNIPAPIEDYLDWEYLGSWREPMSYQQWFQIDSWLQKLLLEEDDE
jgi:hypothetical protein